MTLQENIAAFKAAATYDSAADHFDLGPLSFWDRHGKRAVERLNLQQGHHVLDVGCGTGASALPAAIEVGRDGRVLGLDVAQNMLARAKDKANAQGLKNVTFEARDMMASGLPGDRFDAVISVFSVFFVEDMEALAQELWRMVRPGGQLAITSWGPRAFQPAADIFIEEVLRVRPNDTPPPRPWERLIDPLALSVLFPQNSDVSPEVEVVADSQPLKTPEDWWTIALGSGYRAQIEQLTQAERAIVHDAVIGRLEAKGVTEIETNALHASARKL